MTFPSFPAIKEQKEEEPPKEYEGKVIDSIQEWWIILALKKLNKEFIYQYQLFGGYVRGGAIVDFFVWHAPQNLFIEYYGGYWHEGQMGADDVLRENKIEQETGMKVYGIYQKDGDSKESIYNAVREICG